MKLMSYVLAIVQPALELLRLRARKSDWRLQGK